MARTISHSRWVGNHLMLAGAMDGPGKTFYVDSHAGASTNSGRDWGHALNTLDAAINKCTASHGDSIIVAADHAEDLATAAAVNLDVIGAQVYGLRRGRQMPTFNITATDGTFQLNAAGVGIHNLRFTGGIDAVVSAVYVAAATDWAVVNCEYRDVTGQCTDALLTANNADRGLIDGWTHFGAAAGGTNAALAIDGSDDIEIKNFYAYGNFAVGAIDFRTTLSARVRVHDGTIWTNHAADVAIVDTITNSTGFIGPNLNFMLCEHGANITNSVTGATFQLMDPIYVCNLVHEKAMLINWTASTHA